MYEQEIELIIVAFADSNRCMTYEAIQYLDSSHISPAILVKGDGLPTDLLHYSISPPTVCVLQHTHMVEARISSTQHLNLNADHAGRLPGTYCR